MVKKISVEIIVCMKCSYEWFPRIYNDGSVKSPKICPNCHQDWRRESKVKNVVVRVKNNEVKQKK